MKKDITRLRQEGYFSQSELAFLDEIDKIEKISKAEGIELVKKAQAGDVEARNKLIKTSLNYVAGLSVHFIDKGVDFLDLVQEGTIGLMKAIEKCDVSKTKDFKGYAYYHVYSALDKVTKTSDIIRKPEYYAATCEKLDKVTNLLRHEYHREPTIMEIAKEMGIPTKNVEELLINSQEVESLDKYIDEDEQVTLKDTIPSDEDYYEIIENDLLHGEINRAFEKIIENSPSYKTGVEVLKKHWGFDDDVEHTLESLGREYSSSKESVRTMEAKTIRKVRAKCGNNISR